MTFSVRFTPMYYHDIHGGFFDAGILAVEGEEITLVGRRGDTRPNGRGFWLTSGLVYAGLVSTAWVFYPVLGGAMIPPEYRLTVVLFVPLAAQLLATVVVLGVLPLVVEQWQTYHRSEIREVARRWRQVAFTVMDDRDRPVRQTFYTRTEAEAAAVEGVLRGVAPVG